MQTTAEQVAEIINQVMQQLNTQQGSAVAAPSPAQGGCIFDEMNDAVAAADKAQQELMKLPLVKRGEIIQAIRATATANANMLAEMELAETGYGRLADKLVKITMTIEKTPGIEDITPQVYSGDHGLALVEKLPFGLAGCILPSTAPAATAIHNSICMIAAGNSAIISPHPNASKTALKAVELIGQAIKAAGGPEHLIVSVKEASIAKATEMMKQPKVRFLLVTGGPGVVASALASGKKAICAGPGNPPVLVDGTSDIEQAAADIIAGNSFENCINCIGEKEVFVLDKVAEDLLKAMVKHGAYLIRDQHTLARLVQLVTDDKGAVNKKYVGKNAGVILKDIGITVDESIKTIVFEAPADHITVIEEYLMPLLPVVRVKDVDEGIALAVKAEGGRRHSAIMHSHDITNITKFGKAIQTTILVKNGPSYSGVGIGGEGFVTMSIAGSTGEGLTSPGTFTRVQRRTMVDKLSRYA